MVVRINQTTWGQAPGAKAAVEKGLPEVRTACASAQAKNKMYSGISKYISILESKVGQEMKLER